jgi:hypothetical protein
VSRCAFIREGGEQCKARATEGSTWCYNHDPSKAEERRRAASKGGRTGGNGRPNSSSSELEDIKEQLRAVLGGAYRGKVDRAVAATLFQGFNVLLRAVELERRIKEMDQLEEQIRELELRVFGSSA